MAAHQRRRRLKKQTRGQLEGWGAEVALAAAVWVAGNWSMVWPVLVARTRCGRAGRRRLGAAAGAPSGGRPRISGVEGPVVKNMNQRY
ncbi:hypothetical protein GCM10009730_59080 [Streptomyces albidochromogenes]